MTLEFPTDMVIYRSRLNAKINRNFEVFTPTDFLAASPGSRPEALGCSLGFMRDHTKLRAFELGDQLALAIYQHTRGFPREEIFGLTSQLRRAAVSVPSNIVEGSARSSEAEYIRFIDTAYGSAREVEYQVSLAFRLGLLGETAHRELSALSIETCKVLNGLLRSLRK